MQLLAIGIFSSCILSKQSNNLPALVGHTEYEKECSLRPLNTYASTAPRPCNSLRCHPLCLTRSARILIEALTWSGRHHTRERKLRPSVTAVPSADGCFAWNVTLTRTHGRSSAGTGTLMPCA